MKTLSHTTGKLMRLTWIGMLLLITGIAQAQVKTIPVSYTHLTLPTNREVEISGEADTVKKKKKRSRQDVVTLNKQERHLKANRL